MLKQKEVAMALLAVRKAMDILDDGYHLEDIGQLVKVSNSLYAELNEANQKKFSALIQKEELRG